MGSGRVLRCECVNLFQPLQLELRSEGGLTFRAAVVAADAQPLGVALDIFVVQLDAKRPAQVRLSHRVLQPPPGVGEPVGHLRGGSAGELKVQCGKILA